MSLFTQCKFIELYSCVLLYMLCSKKIYLNDVKNIIRVHGGLCLSFRGLIAEMQVDKGRREW